MLKKSLVCIALVTSLLPACTSAEDSKYSTPKELSDSLLSVTDMPSGWEESQRQVFDTRSVENPSIDPSIWCTQAVSTAQPLVGLAGTSGADVEMSKTVGGGNGATMMRLQAWSNKDVKEYFDIAVKAVDKCDGITDTDSTGVTTATKKIANHTIGDESVSFSQRTEPPASTKDQKFTSMGRTTIARFGNVLMVLQVGDAGPSDSLSLMDETKWWEIVELAADKLD